MISESVGEDHFWLNADAIINLSGRRDDDDWQTQFWTMLNKAEPYGYARSNLAALRLTSRRRLEAVNPLLANIEVRKDSVQKALMSAIPKNLIHFWHDKSLLPPRIKVAQEMTIRTYAGWNHIFADDKVALNVIQEDAPYLAELYEANRIPASRGDIARLALLYRYGGLMIDVAMAFHTSLAEKHDETDEILLVRRDDFAAYKDCPDKAHVISGIIAVPAKSRFMMMCLRKVDENLRSGKLNTRVWKATGPGVLNDILREMKTRYKVRYLGFTDLMQNHFNYMRVPGVNNSWRQEQTDGILSEGFCRQAGIELPGLD